MPVCTTLGCDNEAIFAPTCAMCSLGKIPGPEEVGRSSRPKALAVVAVAQPKATFMGTLANANWDRESKSAEKIAGNPSSGDGATTTVGGLALHHITTPRANYSIWFRRTSGHEIAVYGVGKHVGRDNKKYSIEFYDGSTKNVTLS
ncbi:hypothetical protein Q4S45_11175 [Massilia sp. R2A-15]|uniref:hypothetical protein n=1 Tax=Massilia sp. R2A-15 TaxID=3064278 RepID=UPI002733504C|nr:hypothetical protein [Massilia sp. R2A-15]WLI91651.1 hypothetical protein Q4S45_11175 [Massilia sp. R2A-15]